MCNRKSFLVTVGAAILAVLIAASAHAWSSNTNYLTFNTPVALPGVTLPPGTYTFRLPSEISPNVVQVLNQSESRLYFTGMTLPIERPSGAPNRMVTMGEAVPGRAAPIKAWFPVGQRDGHAFIYQR